MFPVGDRKGRTVAFGARILGEGEPKYLNSPDHPLFHKGKLLYGLSRARTALAQNGAGPGYRKVPPGGAHRAAARIAPLLAGPA